MELSAKQHLYVRDSANMGFTDVVLGLGRSPADNEEEEVELAYNRSISLSICFR